MLSPSQAHDGAALTLLGHVQAEQEGAQHLQALAQEHAPLYGGLFTLLLQMMARDSETHASILRFLCQRWVCRV